jgi:hypothetical protein
MKTDKGQNHEMRAIYHIESEIAQCELLPITQQNVNLFQCSEDQWQPGEGKLPITAAPLKTVESSREC